MKKLLNYFLAILCLSLAFSCEQDEEASLNYVTFEKATYPFGVDINGTTTKIVKVFTGNVTGSDRTFDVVVDPTTTLDASAYTMASSVTVPANSNVGELSIQISDVNIGPSGKRLVLNFAPDQGIFAGAKITINVNQVCPNPESLIAFQFDGYASEITWEVRTGTATGAVLFSGGGYADGLATFSRSVCLTPGAYTFIVNDSYGDGLSFPTNGSATITYNGTVMASIVGDFGSQAIRSFTIN